MGRTQKKVNEDEKPKLHKTMSPEARENMLISLAMDNAEEKLLNGTASSQLIVHFLKLGSQKEKAETDKLKAEAKVANAKVEVMESAKREGDLYEAAIQAFKSYTGDEENEDE